METYSIAQLRTEKINDYRFSHCKDFALYEKGKMVVGITSKGEPFFAECINFLLDKGLDLIDVKCLPTSLGNNFIKKNNTIKLKNGV